MGSVKVYGPAMSTAVARVLACLLEKEVAFELLPVNMAKGEHKKPDYLKLHPFGQVPAFQDEQISLFESRAICRYIAEKYASQGNKTLYGTEFLERASIDQWLEAEGQSFNPPSSTLVFQLAFAPRMGIKQDPAVIALNEQKLEKVLDIYEKRLDESRFLAGDEFSLADLSHLPNIQYLKATEKGEIFSGRKNVSRWWEESSGRDSWKKVVEMQNTNNMKDKKQTNVGRKGEEEVDTEFQIWKLAFGFTGPAVVKCAIELGIADALDDHGQPMTLMELAGALDCAHPYLHRIMRFLVHKGVFKEENASREGKNVATYALTAISRRLTRHGDESLGALVQLETDPMMVNAWHFLSTRVRSSGASAFNGAHGEDVWSLASHSPAQSNLINEAMACDARMAMKALIDECIEVFDGVQTVVDVGGGNGTAMGMLVTVCPWIKAVNFDLPHVVNDALKIDSVHHIGGDMFANVPHADAFFLKFVLHDWGDEECIHILRNCKEALPKYNSVGRVIIVDAVINGDCQNKDYEELRLVLDMAMMAHTNNGKERTEDEWKKILSQAGFNKYIIKPMQALQHVIVAYP